MPTLPTVAIKLLDLTRDPEVDLSDIADLVQFDQALAAKVLNTVNSSYYALTQPCPTIKRALAYLGLNTVKSLVLGFSLVEMTNECDANGFDLLDYWRRCIYSAAAARRIAMATGKCNPDEAFIAALMQDVGMLALHSVLGEEYDQVVAQAEGNHLALPYCESDALGFNHAEAGAALGEQWRLPSQLIDPIRQHHQRGTPFGDHRELVNAVILAYRISNLVTVTQRKHVLDMISAMAQSMFHMSEEDERAVLRQIDDDVRDLSELLNVHLGELPDIDTILSEADDAIVRHQLDMQQSEQLRRARMALDEEAFTDALTGAGNRRKFDKELAVRFREAGTRTGMLSVLLVEPDRFRSLNDSLGSKAGDVVLQTVAYRLRESLGNDGLVCRFNGERFAVLMPEMPRLEAARAAERARRHVEHDFVDLRGTGSPAESVQATVSIGVASLDPELAARLRGPDMLVQLADKALHAAKHQGHNCVRVFTPRADSTAA